MDLKVVLFVVFLIFTLHQNVEADFFYNRVSPKAEELANLGFKCIPGRTVIKMGQNPTPPDEDEGSSQETSGEYLRSHMRWQTDDASCQICVCSIEAKDEYCSKRPAMNVNECIRMAALMVKFKKNDPFDHERSLSFRIRRDYLWHNDEIPYDAKAKCRRGHSYYSNSVNANDTDIDVASDIESLLDYSNKGICFYCVCTMDGNGAGCLSRSPWFCEYFRFLREKGAQRDMYTGLFQQDRPVYFRSLSWRLRRTMDSGMFDLVESVGDGLGSESCVPFVSEYTDCTEDNLCTGCSKCTCTANGKWDCNNVQDCPDDDGDYKDMDDNDIDQALLMLESELKKKETRDKASSDFPLVPGPEKLEDLLLEEKEVNMEDEILALMRSKRSVEDMVQENAETKNDTVKFHHAIDELNEDTLKHQNVSGTLPAQKVDAMPQISRRTSMLNSSSNPLQIEYIQPKENSHKDDNKVDTLAIHDDKEDLLIHSDIYDVIGNHSQESKDKELSKLLVNELKGGVSETIGDKRAPVISNITFTQQNDTLTAMAFIAGNLLNKLWNMEKDASNDHIDTEVLKHEKIADLLALFKEPLSMRQERFLKNALEQLSTALNKNKDMENISLCKNVEVKNLVNKINNISNDKDTTDCDKGKSDKEENKNTATAEALNKINNVLDLIKKYENLQNNLNHMKSEKINVHLRSSSKNLDKVLTKDEKSSLDLYGKTLETITKLLIPNKKKNKVVNSIQNGNLFKTEKDLKRKLSDLKLDILNITSKDKIVLDYLAHIQSNPDCLLKTQQEKVSLPSIEGNILLNLSEFFKIKSLSDFVKIMETEEQPDPVLRARAATTTTQKSVKKTTTDSILKDRPKQFKDTKKKLKGHLKSILEDLMELQNEENGIVNKDIQIIQALPCIYNLLNAGKNEMNKPITISEKKPTAVDNTKPLEKIQEIFSNLKKELKFAQTRRMNTLSGPRPKSAIVWERVIKNADGKQNLGTRRNLGPIPKTMEELKEYMDKIESSGSNTYKNYAYLNEVPPVERLLLLKTFNADTVRYIKALKTILTSLKAKSSITNEAIRELNEFIDNVAININLNEKVVKNMDRPKKVNKFVFDPKRQMRNKAELKFGQPIAPEPTSFDTKLTREQVINQLIKNRLQLYVDTKEAARETQNDMNYDIAKKILLYLNVGKFEIARELYKIFASQERKDAMIVENRNIDLAKEQSNRHATRRRPLQVESLIKFEDPKIISKDAQMAAINQNHFIKQLLNLKNMKL